MLIEMQAVWCWVRGRIFSYFLGRRKHHELHTSTFGSVAITKLNICASKWACSCKEGRIHFNPEHGGLPESTAVAGWVGATPTPVTLLQINSRVQKVACRCSRGFPIMPNLFRKIIVYPLSVGDR